MTNNRRATLPLSSISNEAMTASALDEPEDATVARRRLIARLRRWRKRRRQEKRQEKIRREDAELLRWFEDTARSNDYASDVPLPRTLDEALPRDRSKRNEDDRAIVVTECASGHCMIGCNKAWEDLCGYTESEVLGKDSSILQGPDTNHEALRGAMKLLFEDEAPVQVVTTNYRKDGSKFKNLLTLGPIKDAKGKITHCVAVLKDITHAKKKKSECPSVGGPKRSVTVDMSEEEMWDDPRRWLGYRSLGGPKQ